MFLGEYSHTIDDKGRLTVPSKFRTDLAVGIVVTRGFDQNLMVYPMPGWQKLSERVLSKPISDPRVREFRRLLFSGAADLTQDRQGRILLPPFLREYAGIMDEVVIVGMYDHLEIWSATAWQTQRDRIDHPMDGAGWEQLGI